jgi:hypothetical protein
MPLVIQVFCMQVPSPPGKGEYDVIVVSRDSGGDVVHNAIAVCPSKPVAQTVTAALAAYYGVA